VSTYKRWFPPRLVVDVTTAPPAFVLARQDRWSRQEKRLHQTELHAWEGEGGIPASSNVALQSPSFAEPPSGGDID
jgi:hypothetical protein